MPAFTRSRRVHVLVIWSLLAAVLTGAFLLSGLAAADPTPSLGVSGTALSAPVSEARSAASDAQVKQFVKDYYASKGSRVGLLPAYRWNGDADLYDRLDITDGGSAGMKMVGGVLFSVAQFLWMIVLQVMKLAMDNTIIDAAGDAMNNGSAALVKNLRLSGLVALGIGALAVAAAFAVLRSNLVSAGRILIVGMLMLATMQVVASAGAQARPGAQPVGSPAWLAQFSTTQINSITDKMSSGFGLTEKLSDNIRGGGKTQYNCQTYVGFLQDAYHEAATVDQKAAPLLPVSKLWEKGYLTYFTQAQYGFGTGSPTRSVCHQLDAQTNIKDDEVSDIMRAAYSPAPVPTGEVMDKEPYKTTGVLPVSLIDPTGDYGKFEANVMAWQACSVNPNDPGSSPGKVNMVINPGWEFDDLDDDKCKEWINDGALGATGSDTFFSWGSKDNLANAVANARTNKETVGQIDAIVNNADMLNAFWGHNGNDRVINGLMAAIVASVYAYVLIPLALGTLIAEFGLVLMMMLLPLTLLLLAAGAASSHKKDKKGGSNKSHEIGMRLLKLTGGFVAAKALLTFLLFALVQFIALVEELSTELPFSPILHILTPLIALFLLRFVLKSAGLGNLTSLGGALGMTAASGMQMVAGKDPMVQGLGGAKGKFGNNSLTRGANKMDAATKQRLRDSRFTKPSGKLAKRGQQLAADAPNSQASVEATARATATTPSSAEADVAAKKRRALAAVTTPFMLASSAMHRARSWRKNMAKSGYAANTAYNPHDPNMPAPHRRGAGEYASAWMHPLQHTRTVGGGGVGGVGALTPAAAAAIAPTLLAAAGAVALTEEARRSRMLGYDQQVSAQAAAAMAAGFMVIGEDENGQPIMAPIGSMNDGKRLAAGVNLMDSERAAFRSLTPEQQLAVTNPVERAALATAVAANFADSESQRPFTADQFIVSDSGEVILSEVPRNPSTGERVVPLSKDPQQLVDLMNDYRMMLPVEVRERRADESDQRYADRLFALGVELGYIDQSTGQQVDFWKTQGIDLSSPEGAHLLQEAQAGVSNVLTTLTIDVPQQVVARAEQAVTAKYEILRQTGGVERSYQLLSRTDELIDSRRQEVQVELDVGRTYRTHAESTAAHVAKLDNELRDLTSVAQNIQSLDTALTQAQTHLAATGDEGARQQMQAQIQQVQQQRAQFLASLPQGTPNDPQQLQIVIEKKGHEIDQRVGELEGFLSEVETAALQSTTRRVELDAANTQQEIVLSMEGGIHGPKEIESVLVASESKVGEQLDAAHKEAQRRLAEASEIYNNPDLSWADRIRARLSASDSILADSERTVTEVVAARQQVAEHRAAAQRKLADAATATPRSQDEVKRHGMSLPSA